MQKLLLQKFLVSISLSTLAACSYAQAAKDPFSLVGTWHAVDGTWPGTVKFDSKFKRATLAPMGAPVMDVKYAAKLSKKTKDSGTNVQGTLVLTNAEGQAVQANFKIKDKKNLFLTFKDGQREEKYVHMTPAEEEAETQKIKKLIYEGKLTSADLAKPPSILDTPLK